MAVGKYDTHVKPKLLLIEAWARDGLTDLLIAEKLGISEASFYKYRNEHEEFTESLKNGKEIVDVMVENSLFKRAMGYDFEEVTQEPLYGPDGTSLCGPDGKPIIAVTKIVRKQVAPDTTAQIFWLKNRRPESWRDKKEIDGTLKVTKLEDFFS